MRHIKTPQELNKSIVNENSEYNLNEYTKQNILDDLKRIEKYASKLQIMIEKSRHMDDETKQNIMNLTEMSNEIYNIEMDKELKRQKDDGKKLIPLSDNEIDELVDRIKREENF